MRMSFQKKKKRKLIFLIGHKKLFIEKKKNKNKKLPGFLIGDKKFIAKKEKKETRGKIGKGESCMKNSETEGKSGRRLA